MSQSLIYAAFSLALLLIGVFALRRLWLGALAGILFLAIAHGRMQGWDVLLPTAIDAVIIWLELGLLIKGAYFFYLLLEKRQQMESFNSQLGSVGKRLPVLLLFSWFLGSLMEGVAGFGIPAMVVAPLLFSLGFRPLTCAVIPLAANTAPVTFGALATPLRIGLGITATSEPIVQYVALLNALPIMAMPWLLAWLYAFTEKVTIQWQKEWKGLLLGGLCFLIPYLVGSYLAIELPAVLAGGIGMIAFAVVVLPAQHRPPASLWWKTFFPYLLFVVVLILAAGLLKPFSWQIAESSRKISLFQPGLVFILVGLFFQLLAEGGSSLHLVGQSLAQSFDKVRLTLLSIFLLVFFTQLVGLDMTAAYADVTPQGQLMKWIFFPHLSGIVGSFITGSATMGNLLFAPGLKQLVAGSSWEAISLALLHSGSALGNAISLQNILMVQSVLPTEAEEARIMQLNMPVVAAYMAIVCAIAWLIMHW